MSHQHWRDLTRTQRQAFVAASVVQIGLAAAAWTDLARRPQEAVNGRKPFAYLCFGRAKTKEPTP